MFYWLRRYGILLLVVILAAGWFTWNRVRADRLAERRERYAQTVARLWVAAVEFRNDTTGWAVYRDSVINEHNVSREQLEVYASRYEKKSEKYLPFVERVERLVDSLVGERLGGSVNSVESDTISETD